MLLDRTRSLLLVIDVQERLAPAIAEGGARIARTRLLLEGAGHLEVPVVVTEQYPKGLGPTVADLRPLPEGSRLFEKITFSAMREAAVADHLAARGREQIVLCGMESHVCVLQTALDLLARGYRVFVVADACGSRRPQSHELALARLRQEGARAVNVEMVLFEWLERAGSDLFRTVSRLIR
ncbi:MAG TPA: hydrolase [Rhodospirillales bacterium]|nr:hydrolase [Rhodospirillales bacterium]